MNLRDEVHDLLNEKISDIFIEMHSKYKTTDGDIDPQQEMILSELTEKMSEIISDQISQNMSGDTDPEISELRELSGI